MNVPSLCKVRTQSNLWQSMFRTTQHAMHTHSMRRRNLCAKLPKRTRKPYKHLVYGSKEHPHILPSVRMDPRPRLFAIKLRDLILQGLCSDPTTDNGNGTSDHCGDSP